MIRFKVIRGSHLLLGAAIVLLVLVIGGIALSYAIGEKKDVVNAHANLVKITEEAETNAVFASSGMINLDPENRGVCIEVIPRLETAKAVSTPSVLIYHTHTHEAYEQVSGDRYVAIEAWRTTDQDYSVVRVGEELAVLLRERGFDVVHDTTDHEQNELGTAYIRSLETLQGYEKNFDLYIDLHRDAYIEGSGALRLGEGSQGVAQLMLLVGNGKGFEIKPFYEENLLFAQILTERINRMMPGLCKDVLVKDGRYNQNIGIFSVLVEVGHNRNTLAEAIRALPYLADGIHSLMLAEPDETLVQLAS